MRSLPADEPLYRALFEWSPAAIAVVDERWHVRAANRAFTCGVQAMTDEMAGRHLCSALGCGRFSGARDRCGGEPDGSCGLRTLVDGDRVAALSGDLYLVAKCSDPEEVGVPLVFSTVHVEGRPHAIVMVDDGPSAGVVDRAHRGPTQEPFHGIVGRDPSILRVADAVRQFGEVNVPVLIMGESGTGKELIAQALHRESARRGRPLVPVNCGALAEGLLESELFGHVRGAFTGAARDKKGRFELAHRGTIFLDEIGELSPKVQVKLLRVLQDGSFDRVGGERTFTVDVRVLCATNRDLEHEVKAGRFRADLFYRLAVVSLVMPPLRERQGDIPLLVEHLLRHGARELGRVVPPLSPETLRALVAHSWPGNVRELDNALRYALIRARSARIEVEHLPPSVLRDLSPEPAPTAGDGPHLEAARVVDALCTVHGNKTRAAELLGISRSTLYRFLRSLATH